MATALKLITEPAQSLSPAADVEYALEALAEAALTAQSRANDAAAEAKSATDAFKNALEAAGKLDADTKAVGIVRTVIYPTRRFDETLARSLMTAKLQKECSQVVLDTKLVQAKVSPEQYEAMQKTSGYTLKLSIDKEQAA